MSDASESSAGLGGWFEAVAEVLDPLLRARMLLALIEAAQSTGLLEAAQRALSAPNATADVVEVELPRRPVLTFWLIAVALEVVLGVAFLLTGADGAIDTGLSKAGIDFSSDLVTAVRVVGAYPAALVGVTLALAQVAAPDLAVSVVARDRDARSLQ